MLYFHINRNPSDLNLDELDELWCQQSCCSSSCMNCSKNFITWAFTRNLYYMTFNIFSNKSIFLMKLDCILVCFYKLQIIEN